jgi:hypothetical protein
MRILTRMLDCIGDVVYIYCIYSPRDNEQCKTNTNVPPPGTQAVSKYCKRRSGPALRQTQISLEYLWRPYSYWTSWLAPTRSTGTAVVLQSCEWNAMKSATRLRMASQLWERCSRHSP